MKQKLEGVRLRLFIFLICGLVAVLSLEGCEPLRKKFTRKKKEEKAMVSQPLFEPEDYGSPERSAALSYRHHYTLWRMWHKEIMRTFDESPQDSKRLLYQMEQLHKQLIAMQTSLGGEEGQQLLIVVGQVEELRGKLAQPAGVRNNQVIKRNLVSIEKDVYLRFRPRVLEKD